MVAKKREICCFFFTGSVDCGYKLEPPRFGAKIRKNTPVFFCIKVGFKGVYIIRTCYRDEYYFVAHIV